MVQKLTVDALRGIRASEAKIAMVVAYDYALAKAAELAGIDAILAGDSGGMVALGHESTVPVTMDNMVAFTSAVRKGAPNTFVIGDMPFGSYEESARKAVRNAIRLVKEGGADAVKLEGGSRVAPQIRKISQANVPVMGHLGLTPQTAPGTTGYRPYGRSDDQILELHRDLLAVEDAGAFAVLLEGIPGQLTAIARTWVSIPVYGIGAGVETDGQLLLSYDLLGLFPSFRPKFARNFLPAVLDSTERGDNFFILAQQCFAAYGEAVRQGSFPNDSETYALPPNGTQLLSVAEELATPNS